MATVHGTLRKRNVKLEFGDSSKTDEGKNQLELAEIVE
jgi:hypothetical protein